MGAGQLNSDGKSLMCSFGWGIMLRMLRWRIHNPWSLQYVLVRGGVDLAMRISADMLDVVHTIEDIETRRYLLIHSMGRSRIDWHCGKTRLPKTRSR